MNFSIHCCRFVASFRRKCYGTFNWCLLSFICGSKFHTLFPCIYHHNCRHIGPTHVRVRVYLSRLLEKLSVRISIEPTYCYCCHHCLFHWFFFHSYTICTHRLRIRFIINDVDHSRISIATIILFANKPIWFTCFRIVGACCHVPSNQISQQWIYNRWASYEISKKRNILWHHSDE